MLYVLSPFYPIPPYYISRYTNYRTIFRYILYHYRICSYSCIFSYTYFPYYLRSSMYGNIIPKGRTVGGV
ncbi:hypothetical protein Holit_01387 [Hollandina sp. SP2]